MIKLYHFGTVSCHKGNTCFQPYMRRIEFLRGITATTLVPNESIKTIIFNEKETIDILVATIEQFYQGRLVQPYSEDIVISAIENDINPDLIAIIGMIESGGGNGAPNGFWFGVTNVKLETRKEEIDYVAQLLAGKHLPQYKYAEQDIQKLHIFNGGGNNWWNDPSYPNKYIFHKNELDEIRKQLTLNSEIDKITGIESKNY